MERVAIYAKVPRAAKAALELLAEKHDTTQQAVIAQLIEDRALHELDPHEWRDRTAKDRAGSNGKGA